MIKMAYHLQLRLLGHCYRGEASIREVRPSLLIKVSDASRDRAVRGRKGRCARRKSLP